MIGESGGTSRISFPRTEISEGASLSTDWGSKKVDDLLAKANDGINRAKELSDLVSAVNALFPNLTNADLGITEEASVITSPDADNGAQSDVVASKGELIQNQPMNTAVPREELDAKLDALRQEMRADSTAIRGDFDRMRADMATMVGGISASVGEVKGGIDGLKTSITTMQWVFGTFMAALGLWLTYLQLKPADAPAPVASAAQQPPAIIINVPSAPAPAASR